VYIPAPMSSDPRTHPSQEPKPVPSSALPTLALLLATLAWAGSFTWAKVAGDAMNQAAGLPSGTLLGPILLLAWRFTAAGLLWLLIFPAARQGWTWRSCRRSVILGALLWAGQTVQMLGLDRTSEAVNAFLTSLTVVFVPLSMVVIVRRPPPAAIWLPVSMAAVGIWLMTGATPAGFGAGEALGLGCAVLFSAHMIALGEIGRDDSPWRMAAGQLLSVGLASAATSLFVSHGPIPLTHRVHWEIVTSAGIWLYLVLLIVISTMTAFGLMFYFQPKIDPTRAALIYLAEPVFAALYAYMTVGRTLMAIGFVGAGLILGANVLVELLERRTQRRSVLPPSHISSPRSPAATPNGLRVEP
jgi:drug/metabolite transporter (DMT)-like permease